MLQASAAADEQNARASLVVYSSKKGIAKAIPFLLHLKLMTYCF